jgi:hypothetical protein
MFLVKVSPFCSYFSFKEQDHMGMHGKCIFLLCVLYFEFSTCFSLVHIENIIHI